MVCFAVKIIKNTNSYGKPSEVSQLYENAFQKMPSKAIQRQGSTGSTSPKEGTCAPRTDQTQVPPPTHTHLGTTRLPPAEEGQITYS